MVKSILEKEVQVVLSRFFIGMVCVSVLVFSLFQLGYAFQLWVAQYKDSFQMSCVLFSSTLFLSMLAMYLLLKKRKIELDSLVKSELNYPLIGMSLREKGFDFARGLIDGLVNGRSAAISSSR